MNITDFRYQLSLMEDLELVTLKRSDLMTLLGEAVKPDYDCEHFRDTLRNNIFDALENAVAGGDMIERNSADFSFENENRVVLDNVNIDCELLADNISDPILDSMREFHLSHG